MFEIRYGIVFLVDGLNLEGVIKDLSNYGEVTDVLDEMLGDDPVKIVFITCDFAKAFKLKLDYNCVSAEDNKYLLFPMKDMFEAAKVLRARD